MKHVILNMCDINTSNVNQKLQAILLQVPPDTTVRLSNYTVTRNYFKDHVLTTLLPATLDLFVDVLRRVSYDYQSILKNIEPVLTEAQLKVLAAGRSYEFIGNMLDSYDSKIKRGSELGIALTRILSTSVLTSGDVDTREVQRSMRALQEEDRCDWLRKRPELITALVQEDLLDDKYFKIVAESDNSLALITILKYCTDPAIGCWVLHEKRHILEAANTGEYNKNGTVPEAIGAWVATHYNNLNVSVEFKPLIKEASNV